MRILAVLALGGVLLTGCSVAQDMEAADLAVQDFHKQLNAGQMSEIYAGSDKTMKQSASEAQLTSLLDAVHRKLGPYVSGQQTSWNNNVTTGGHTIRVQYASRYERGEATETFVFRMGKGGEASLAGYNINSMALITN